MPPTPTTETAKNRATELLRATEQDRQLCRAAPHSEIARSIPGPPGPAGFLDTVVDPKDNSCISWPVNYTAYMTRQATRTFAAKGRSAPRAGTGHRPAPATRYPIDHPDLYQNGVCPDCRNRLNEQYGDENPQIREQAALRWALAVHTARHEGALRWEAAVTTEPASPPPELITPITLAKTNPGRRQPDPAAVLPPLAAQWNANLEPEAVTLAREHITLPIRLAGHVTARHNRPACAVITVRPEPETGAEMRHRITAGVMPTGEMSGSAAQAVAAEIAASAAKAMQAPIDRWLTHIGRHWEHIYIHPDDYADKRRLPPRARRGLENACGQRLHHAARVEIRP